MSPDEPHYLLGHTESELRRLDIQGDLYRDITRGAFERAGIEAGMRVLDIGCGTGDVSLVAARLVGPDGYVLGIDRGEGALAVARAKALAADMPWAEFERHEVADFERTSSFDALVGRFVLMHQSDAAAVLAKAARSVRPGGVVVMIESYMELLRTGGHSHPHSPLYDRIVRFKSEVVSGAGADLHAGGRLRSTFGAAGLPSPECRLETRLEGGAASPYYAYVAESIRSMLPEAARTDVRGFTAADVPGLEDRLRSEVTAIDGVLVVWPAVIATVRL
ncbi:MAG: methyltransferase domain-containing protein [Gemmatimonadota bacterium]|nr:methyltransferase domain-containing protein [Gemmatimonadota bacterium]MDH3424743.1 methyltransferase domain-containing protein [Gemmatimonadota bacterium]